MQVENQYAFFKKIMNIGLGNLIIRLSFLCRLPDIKITWKNPWEDGRGIVVKQFSSSAELVGPKKLGLASIIWRNFEKLRKPLPN